VQKPERDAEDRARDPTFRRSPSESLLTTHQGTVPNLAHEIRCPSTHPALRLAALMALIRSIFWFALFVASTFCFIVVFEHGFSDFGSNAKKEVESLKTIFGMGSKKATPPAK
jgi:hypothetical protein